MNTTQKLNAIIPIALILFHFGCGSEESAKKIPTPVKTRVVEEYRPGSSTRYTSNIEPKHQVALAFKVGGYVESLHQVRDINGAWRDIQEGDRVKRGTVLARIRKSDYQAKIGQAKGLYAEAQAGLEQATLDFERAGRLLESESITRSDYDAAKARHDAYQFKVDAAKAQLQEAEIAWKDSDLIAPMNAIVLHRNIEPGDLAGTGTVAFLLADTSFVKAVFGVPDLMVGHFQLGQPLTVVTEAVPGVEFRGVITRISPAADSRTRLFETEIMIPNPDDRIKPGMIATIIVGDVAPAAPFLVVPLTSVVRAKGKGDQFAVMVVETDGAKKIAHQRDVTLGETFGDTIAVQQGLRNGEQVITTGATLVIDGEEVSVIP